MESKYAYSRKCAWKTGNINKQEIFDFCEGYKEFLNRAVTEREFVFEAEREAQKHGFADINSFKNLKPGDKVYRINRGKGIVLAVIGSDSIESGSHIVGAHVDSPRLDLKQNPLYEDGEMALLKTHYYGGLRKYQWLALPLAMHGRVLLADGSFKDISIGGEGDDFTFTVSDLLPHLAREQAGKPLRDAFDGENLNIIVGSIPVEDSDIKQPIKAAVLEHLNQEYGMIEEDFLSAEIEMVPAIKTKDVGFDRSLIGGPAQDDRVCAYTALKGIFGTKIPKKTAFCLLVDKEEIGSMGNTGMQSRFFENTLAEICVLLGFGSDISVRRCLSNSKCLSADVNAAFDPNFASVYEKNNAALLGHGVTISKYTGHGGKSESSDASAEFMGEIRRLFNKNGVVWQTAELGKVGAGGGGTIAQYVANLDVDTIDCGTALLSMHAPFEISSKVDVYMTYKAYHCFLTQE